MKVRNHILIFQEVFVKLNYYENIILFYQIYLRFTTNLNNYKYVFRDLNLGKIYTLSSSSLDYNFIDKIKEFYYVLAILFFSYQNINNNIMKQKLQTLFQRVKSW